MLAQTVGTPRPPSADLGQPAQVGVSAPREDKPLTLVRGPQTVTVHALKTSSTSSGRQAVADRLIVGFQDAVDAAQAADVHRAVSARAVLATHSLGALVGHAQLVEINAAGGQTLDEVARQYRADPRVRYAEPDFVARVAEVPNDPRFGQQWGMSRIQAPPAWDVTHGSSSRTIAILDCGIFDETSTVLAPDGQPGHPDLRGKVVLRQDFSGSSTGTDDYCNHGTHVAGIAAASTNNGVGVAGVGYDTSLLNGKVLDDTGSGSTSTIASGITWATDHGATVINLSLGAAGACPTTMQDAVNYAWSHGTVVAAAAGNDGANAVDWPADCTNALAVAATDSNDARATFSNYGTAIPLAAPGVDILSTSNTGDYVSFSGTSMAAPHVSGLVALVAATSFGTSAQAIVSRIETTGDPIAGTGTFWQFGRINAATAVGAAPGATPTPTPTPVRTSPTIDVRQLSLPTHDLRFDRASGSLFVSVPSRGGSIGNSITSVDPVAGTLGASTWVGSEPNRLAESTDGQYLYVGLDGAAAVRRYNIAAHSADVQIALGTGAYPRGPILAADLAVVPSSPRSVVVARRSSMPGSTQDLGVAVFDDTVQRPNVTPDGVPNIDLLGYSDTSSVLYGLDTADSAFAFSRIAIDASGATIASSTSNVTGTAPGNYWATFEVEGGLFYLSTGDVIDPNRPAWAGRFGNGFPRGTLVRPDSANGRVFFLEPLNPVNGVGTGFVLHSYDLKTFTEQWSSPISAANGTGGRLVLTGTDRLAFNTTTDQLFLLQIGVAQTVRPTPTPLPTSTPPSIAVRQVALTTNDLVSPADGQLFASVPSAAGSIGNSITAIDPVAATIGTSTWIGSEPDQLAASDDGQYLYATLDGAAAVRRYIVATHAADQQLWTGSDPNYEQLSLPGDIVTMPGSPQSIAVAKMARCCNNTLGIAIYDNGVARPYSGGAAPVIEFGASSARLYGYATNASGGELTRFSVSASGLSSIDPTSTFGLLNGSHIEFRGGRMYDDGGFVADPEARIALGRFVNPQSANQSGGVLLPDVSANVVYFLNARNFTIYLDAYDMSTYVPLWSAPIPGATSTFSSGVFNQFSSLVRWGPGGLAFRTAAGQLFLLQIGSPTSTGTLPPPTPSPTPPPASVRQVSLRSNAIAYDATHQQLYASVPASAGASGSSVVPVDPNSGAAGSPIAMAGEPNKIAISDNGQYLYAGIDANNSVQRVDLSLQAALPQFSLGAEPGYGPNQAYALFVLPGNSNAIVAARVPPESPTGGFYNGRTIAVYDSGVQRSSVAIAETRGSDVLAPDGTLLYSTIDPQGTSPFGYQRIAIGGSGASNVDTTMDLETSTHPALGPGGLLDFRGGDVVDPLARHPVGRFAATMTDCRNSVCLAAADPAYARVLFLEDETPTSTPHYVLQAFDGRTYLSLWTLPLPQVQGTPTDLIGWGAGRVAFRTDAGQIFVIDLTQANVTSPTATLTATRTLTPTPSLSVTPTPIPSPTSPQSQVVTFDDLASPNRPLTGQYPTAVIDWGSGAWYLSDPWGKFTTNSISFNGPNLTSASFAMLASRVLTQLDVYNGGSTASTITLTCAGNPSVQSSVAGGQLLTLSTNWTTACASVTVGSSNGWDTNFDNLVLGSGQGAPPAASATPTPSPTLTLRPTLTPTSTLTATPMVTPSPSPTPSPTQSATPTPTPTQTPATSGGHTVTFDDLTSPNRPLSGQYPTGVIDWGSGAWYLSGPWGQFRTNSISFDGGGLTSAALRFLGTQTLVQVDAYNGGASSSTISMTCPGQPPVQVTLAANQVLTITTGWTSPCSAITIGSSNGWATNFDNLVYQ